MNKEQLSPEGWPASLDLWTFTMQRMGYTQWEIADMLRKWVDASDAAIGKTPDKLEALK